MVGIFPAASVAINWLPLFFPLGFEKVSLLKAITLPPLLAKFELLFVKLFRAGLRNFN
jgi:hypothetical protein